ncbi:hypothetical protein [Streptomyces gardneri]|uniref:hypothetical protein n=1 Tax=Streptomyces gardneri TaxID=66892 RepID=UPI0033D39162
MPDSTNETTGTSYAKTRTEGTWYLHVRGIDGSGTGGATSHYCFTVDTSAPGAPAVTAPLTGGSATKLLWDTSSLSGSGGLQIGARFDGAYAPPEADPVSAVVDRVEVIDDGGPGDVRQQSEPAQAYALEQPAARSPQPAARAAEACDAFAPPYIDSATGELVAPVVESASADEATAPIQVTQAPADEGSGSARRGHGGGHQARRHLERNGDSGASCRRVRGDHRCGVVRDAQGHHGDHSRP